MYQQNLQDDDKFWQRFHSYCYGIRRSLPTPINFVRLFPKVTDGQLSPISENLFIHYILLPRQELKYNFFILICANNHASVKFLDKPHVENILRLNAPDTLNQFSLNFFSQSSFMCVKPRINSEWSRCFFLVFSASLNT